MKACRIGVCLAWLIFLASLFMPAAALDPRGPAISGYHTLTAATPYYLSNSVLFLSPVLCLLFQNRKVKHCSAIMSVIAVVIFLHFSFVVYSYEQWSVHVSEVRFKLHVFSGFHMWAGSYLLLSCVLVAGVLLNRKKRSVDDDLSMQ